MHKKVGKVMIISGYAPSLINFRWDLLKLWVDRGFEVVACAPDIDDEVTLQLESIGIRYISYPLQRNKMNLFSDLKCLTALYHICKQERPDLVFNYTIKPVIYGSIAARLAGVPKIYSMITGLGYAFIGKGWKKKLVTMFVSMLYRVALGCNKNVFFQNPDDTALFLERNILKSGKEVLVNGSGVDIEHFSVADLPKQMHFLMISRLLKEKGVYEYVEAAKRVRKLHPNVLFSLAGWIEGAASSVSQSELDAWIKEGVISFLGKLDDVRPAIAACNVYVLPSYREGTPRTVLEAMAMGRPVITSDAPGCRETVTDGKNGLLVQPQNVVDLVEKMLTIIASPEVIDHMGQASLKIVKEKYDVHKVNAVMLQEMGCDEKIF